LWLFRNQFGNWSLSVADFPAVSLMVSSLFCSLYECVVGRMENLKLKLEYQIPEGVQRGAESE